jgi:rsbT co-antagonist protein RsbR
MTDQAQQGVAQALMAEMGLNEGDLARRKMIVAFDSTDLRRIEAVREIVLSRIDEYTDVFFDHLRGLPEVRPLLARNKGLIDRGRQLKKEHLAAMVAGDYGLKYVEQRLELASLYARVGLDTPSFLGAFHMLLKSIGADVMRRFAASPLEGHENFMSLKKIAFFDLGVFVDVLVFERERVIHQQQEAIRELSTPVLQLREQLLLLPIIGVIDTLRARIITDNLLRAIRTNRARAVVMDVTGVAMIDSKVANHILQTVTAARLMGTEVIVSGLSTEVAAAVAALGIEMDGLNTAGDLQGGLEQAERALGYRPVQPARVLAEAKPH